MTQGIECIDGSAMYFMSTWPKHVRYNIMGQECGIHENQNTGIFHSHTRRDLSSEVDTKRRFLSHFVKLSSMIYKTDWRLESRNLKGRLNRIDKHLSTKVIVLTAAKCRSYS